MRYRAFIIGPEGNHTDPLSHEAIIYITRDGETGERAGLAFTEKGWRWEKSVEGALPSSHVGIRLPAEALEAVVEALDRYRGAPSHARTEAAVLRETLDVERKRVDRFLNAALTALGPPRIIDMPTIPGPLPVSAGWLDPTGGHDG